MTSEKPRQALTDEEIMHLCGWTANAEGHHQGDPDCCCDALREAASIGAQRALAPLGDIDPAALVAAARNWTGVEHDGCITGECPHTQAHICVEHLSAVIIEIGEALTAALAGAPTEPQPDIDSVLRFIESLPRDKPTGAGDADTWTPQEVAEAIRVGFLERYDLQPDPNGPWTCEVCGHENGPWSSCTACGDVPSEPDPSAADEES